MEPPVTRRLTVVPPPGIVPPVREWQLREHMPPDLVFLDLVDLVCTLRVVGAWAELRSLLCEDARLETIASRGIAGPDATIEAMRFAAAGDAETVREFEVESLAEQVALVRAAISRAGQDEPDTTVLEWVVSGRDGLIWRSRRVESRDEAERILRDSGRGLGM
jgi:hypothetical protein